MIYRNLLLAFFLILMLVLPAQAAVDFATRCAAAGVVWCEGFDDYNADIAPYLTQTHLTSNWPTLDTSEKVSGAGSMKMVIPSNSGATNSAQWTRDFGQIFGENTTFYVQYRYRVDSGFMGLNNANTGSAGIKMHIIHGLTASCANIEHTLVKIFARGNAIRPYDNCGGDPDRLYYGPNFSQSDYYLQWSPNYSAGTSFKDPVDTKQQGISNNMIVGSISNSNKDMVLGPIKCRYGQGYQAPDCWLLPANQWVTFYFEKHTGDFNQANSWQKFYAAYDGQPLIQLNDRQNKLETPFGNSIGYDKILLTTYMTAKDASKAHDPGTVWFDELIVSSQPIADPHGDAANEHTLTVSKSGNGDGTITSSPGSINCGVTCSENFTNNTTVTLTATPDGSSTFNGWSGSGCSGSGTCQITMTAPASATADFSLTAVTGDITVTLAGGGTGTVTSSGGSGSINCPGTCTDTFDENDVVTLTATPDGTDVFDGWSGGGCSGTGTCQLTVMGNVGVTATFSPMVSTVHTIQIFKVGAGLSQVTSNPSGLACGEVFNLCSVDMETGMSVTITNTVNSGTTFEKWTGDCTGTGACVLTMDGDKQVFIHQRRGTIVERINFQPDALSVPSGYTKDIGAAYTGGAGFGWGTAMVPPTGDAVNQSASPYDSIFTSYVFLEQFQTTTWTYDVANGNYLVSLSSGDATQRAGHRTIAIEGVPVISNVDVDIPGFSLVNNQSVIVTDGEINVTVESHADDAKMNWLIIESDPTTTTNLLRPSKPTGLSITEN